MTDRDKNRKNSLIRTQRRYAITALIIFMMMLSFPALVMAAPVQEIFADWSPVAVEFFLLFMTILTLFLSFAHEPKRVDEDGKIDLSWPP